MWIALLWSAALEHLFKKPPARCKTCLTSVDRWANFALANHPFVTRCLFELHEHTAAQPASWKLHMDIAQLMCSFVLVIRSYQDHPGTPETWTLNLMTSTLLMPCLWVNWSERHVHLVMQHLFSYMYRNANRCRVSVKCWAVRRSLAGTDVGTLVYKPLVTWAGTRMHLT